MILSQNLLTRVLADFAEFIIGVNDVALSISNADDGVLIQREFLMFYSRVGVAQAEKGIGGVGKQ